MDYFSNNYSRIHYPTITDTSAGLRNAQLGAIHAIASFFTIEEIGPGLVVMPTGSGKTALLNMCPYVLRAKRVLVISSTILVRGQIFEEFSTLKTLKASNVCHADLPCPVSREVLSPIKSWDEWNSFEDVDVVIGIPNSLNEGLKNGIVPPPELFDLILVDEAHHVPAYTWSNIVAAFPKAKKVFFTATPFRRDRKEIDGELIYNYSISRAFRDKIFGNIGYYAVNPNGVNPDLALAKEAESIFKKDREAGLKHFLMVRTESKEDSENLRKLYAENTDLKLKKVDSSVSFTNIKRTIEKLKNGELDGIICVDMLGEGFDFPNLKIAAIHSPKKSLASTLQFIGRFARTNAENIGEAKFLAIPNDIEIGRKRLYAEGAIWNDIIHNLSEEVILKEDEIKTALDTFEEVNQVGEIKPFSLYNLVPFCHVKIYRAYEVDFGKSVEFSSMEIIHHYFSEDSNSLVIITRERNKPKWLTSDDMVDVNHYLFLLHYNAANNLLFVHSSIKTNQFYDDLVSQFTEEFTRIPKYIIHRVLIDVSDTEFFNIGMQNRSPNSGESYRIITGPNAETTIRKSHGRTYSNGHIYAKGVFGGQQITIGYSSGSKVWSNAYEQIPIFIAWCSLLADKMASDRLVKTNTGFDNLPIGQPVQKFPAIAHSAIWNHETFSLPPIIYTTVGDEIIADHQLLNYEIVVDKNASTEDRLFFDLVHQDSKISLTYDFENHFQFATAPDCSYLIEIHEDQVDLLTYLNDNPLQVYLDDFAAIINHDYYPPPSGETLNFDENRVAKFDWNNTDIEREFYDNSADNTAPGKKASIHYTIEQHLKAQTSSIILYDHGNGEIADFVTFIENAASIEINLYHIKGAGGAEIGDRVNDLYEVCMQVVKSQSWVKSKHSFYQKVRDRVGDSNDKFVKGDLQSVQQILTSAKRIIFKFVIVQPGISKDTLSEKLSYLLAATDDAIINNGYEPIDIIGS